MSKLTLLACSVLGLPAIVTAQDASAWRDSAYRITAELRVVRDSIAREESGMEEIARRPGLLVSATTKYQPIAAEVLARFDSTRRRWFGEAFPAAEGFRIVLRTGDRWSTRRRGGGEHSLMIIGLPDGEAASRVSPLVRESELRGPEEATRSFLDQFGRMMMGATGAPLPRWIPTGIPLMISDAARREAAMYALVTGDGPAQRDCVTGVLAACGYVLGLRESATPDPGAKYLPLARADLLLTALDLGGPGAWDRLPDAPGASIEAHLAAAAGMPPDSLLARWRNGLLALRPDHGPLDVPTIAILLGWSGLVLIGALGIARWV